MKHFNLLPIVLILAMVGFSMYGCKEDEPTKTPDPEQNDTNKIVDTLRYTGNIKLILDSNCNVPYCHQSGASLGSLASYADAKAFVANGRILGAIKHETGFSAMPKNGPKLADEKIARIEKWISQGTKE